MTNIDEDRQEENAMDVIKDIIKLCKVRLN